ncbi:MAG: diguanylate cyclase [Phycisphaerales bacterium]|nr:MAG: diguanylate cyclase [Phycisphaerales bacterium]
MHLIEPHEPRLLAIDDSELIHRLLKARLKHEHIEIHSACSGLQGLEIARTLMPDVILLDIDMPGIDGFEVLRRLRAEPALHDIPVIFISSQSNTMDKVRGLDLGAHDFVTKPFDLTELKARVRSALRVRQLIRMLAQRAQLDGLTGLWNHAYFTQRLEEEIANSQRHETSLSLIMCDLDRFKNINDEFGHPFGDHVLEMFSQLLADGRVGDIPCRYGGEEFTLILPQTTIEEAGQVADRLREKVKSLVWEGHPELTLTASFGVTDLYRAGAPTIEAVVAAADQALYAAKQDGRDRVRLAEPKGPPMKLTA